MTSNLNVKFFLHPTIFFNVLTLNLSAKFFLHQTLFFNVMTSNLQCHLQCHLESNFTLSFCMKCKLAKFFEIIIVKLFANLFNFKHNAN